jgi:hypothetical protein
MKNIHYRAKNSGSYVQTPQKVMETAMNEQEANEIY